MFCGITSACGFVKIQSFVSKFTWSFIVILSSRTLQNLCICFAVKDLSLSADILQRKICRSGVDFESFFLFDRGGLPITISGRNFDSVYGYFDNPVLPLTRWPHLGVWVGPDITGGPEFVDMVI